MMFTSKLLFVGLGAAAGLAAQQAPSDPIRFDVEGRLTWALSSLTKVTDRRMGEGLGIGVMLPTPFPKDQCLGIRLGLNANTFPGTMRQTAKTSLRNVQFTSDICFPSWWQGTSWFLGLSGNRYSATNSGTETYVKDPVNRGYMLPIDTFMVRSKDTKGVRAGFRCGFTARLSSHLDAVLTFQQTELTQRIMEPYDANGYTYTESLPVNPAWIETAIRFTF
jgi:hypothetical protein